jgi:hypothetical protein
MRKQHQQCTGDSVIAAKLDALRGVLDAMAPETSAADIVGAADGILREPTWLAELSTALLEEFETRQREEAPFRGLFRDGGADALTPFGVLEHPNLRLVLESLDAPLLNAARAAGPALETLVFSGQHASVRMVGHGSVTLQIYRTDRFDDCTDFAAPRSVHHEDPVTIRTGSPLVHINRMSGFRLVSAEGAPLLMLTTTPVDASPVTLHVSAETGKVIKVAPNSTRHSPLPFHLSVLSLLGDERAAGVAESMASHDAFFVRWDAMRQLAMMRGEGALETLEYFMSGEANPMVLRAAHALKAALQKAA